MLGAGDGKLVSSLSIATADRADRMGVDLVPGDCQWRENFVGEV